MTAPIYLILASIAVCARAYLSDGAIGSLCVTETTTCTCDLIAAPVKHGHLSTEFFKKLLFTCCKPGVTKLSLKGAIIDRIPGDVFTQTACHNIEELSFAKTGISGHPESFPEDGKAFLGLPNLAKISFIDNPKLDSYPIGAFSGLGLSISEIILQKNPVKTLHGKEFDGLSELRRKLKLDLSENLLEDVKLKAFETLPLQELILDGNQLTDLKPEMFEGLSSLTHLSLANNPIQTIIGGSLRYLANLQSLTITTPRKSKREREILTLKQSMLHGLTGLRELTLEGLGFEEAEANALTEQAKLKHLNLSRNKFKTVPKKALERLAVFANAKLQLLDLSENHITCLDHEAFRAFEDLRKLRLESNLITAIADKAFIGLISLSELDLSHNPIRVLTPRSFAKLESLRELKLGPVMDFAKKEMQERFALSAIGMVKNSTRVRGLETLGIRRGGGFPVPVLLDTSRNSLPGECPIWGVPGVDFAWKHRPNEDLILDEARQAESQEESTMVKLPSSEGSWLELVTSKKNLTIALIVTISLITILIAVIIVMYRVRNGKRTGSNSSLIRQRKNMSGLCRPTNAPNSASEYGGSAMSNGLTPGNLYPTYPGLDIAQHFYQEQILCTSPQGSQKSTKKWGAECEIAEAALHLAPPPYPQHTRSPHQLFMMNFNAMETASNGSGGTLVSGQHHPLLGSSENGRGSDSHMAAGLMGPGAYAYQSPRNKSASTEQTTTPCTASSLVDEGSAGSGLGLKPFLNYGGKTRNLYSPGSPASSGHDRMGSPICAAGLHSQPSNCSSPRHQCCSQQMLLSGTADFGLV